MKQDTMCSMLKCSWNFSTLDWSERWPNNRRRARWYRCPCLSFSSPSHYSFNLRNIHSLFLCSWVYSQSRILKSTYYRYLQPVLSFCCWVSFSQTFILESTFSELSCSPTSLCCWFSAGILSLSLVHSLWSLHVASFLLLFAFSCSPGSVFLVPLCDCFWSESGSFSFFSPLKLTLFGFKLARSLGRIN